MDTDISEWVLDFLVTQPLPDSTLAHLLKTIPLSDTDTFLKKHLLLRQIDSEVASNAVSVSVLELLIHIAELDCRENVVISESMKRAYCYVAVHCTVRLLQEGLLYFEAVKKIWRTRAGCVLKLGLVSDELVRWKDEIEAGVWADDAGEVLLEKSKGLDVVQSVRVYVEEARGMMGPSFLQVIAESMREEEAVKEACGIGKEDIHKGNVQRRSKPSGAKKRREFNSRTRGVKFVESEDPTLEQEESHTRSGRVSPADVTKLQDEFQTSTSSLQAKLKDPLPDTLNVAKNVSSKLGTVHLSTEKSNPGIKGSPHQTDATKARLMEKNNTTRAYEQDESTDRSAGPATRPHLPTPKKRVVSPLKKCEDPKPLRRKRKRWSKQEEETLRTGVRKCGVGNWKLILYMYQDIFDGRTEVDLKDKWRNLIA